VKSNQCNHAIEHFQWTSQQTAVFQPLRHDLKHFYFLYFTSLDSGLLAVLHFIVLFIC